MNKIDGGITGDSISSLTRESARGGDEEALLMMRSVVGAANDDAPSTTCTYARHAARTSNLVPNNELSNVSQIIENDIVSNNTDQSGVALGLCLTKSMLASTTFGTAPGKQSSDFLRIIAAQMNHCLIQIYMLHQTFLSSLRK